MTTLALFGQFGYLEIGAILLIGLLLFGKRLPEVGRSLGKSIVEFKKGIKGIEDEIESESRAVRTPPSRIETSNDDRTVSRDAAQSKIADSTSV
ncbi:MAG: twin-arginine translocase TatA/TatE family subunit [Phycisphaeraceae bacterium]|nr:twin-arginine translocase TatA/TatE family subunit [Phycisphaerales bacterium]MCB9860870.1 twin-arginine translocase TatA/TatE family subunit [Phycisphaeraceae bacterium]